MTDQLGLNWTTGRNRLHAWKQSNMPGPTAANGDAGSVGAQNNPPMPAAAAAAAHTQGHQATSGPSVIAAASAIGSPVKTVHRGRSLSDWDDPASTAGGASPPVPSPSFSPPLPLPTPTTIAATTTAALAIATRWFSEAATNGVTTAQLAHASQHPLVASSSLAATTEAALAIATRLFSTATSAGVAAAQSAHQSQNPLPHPAAATTAATTSTAATTDAAVALATQWFAAAAALGSITAKRAQEAKEEEAARTIQAWFRGWLLWHNPVGSANTAVERWWDEPTEVEAWSKIGLPPKSNRAPFPAIFLVQEDEVRRNRPQHGLTPGSYAFEPRSLWIQPKRNWRRPIPAARIRAAVLDPSSIPPPPKWMYLPWPTPLARLSLETQFPVVDDEVKETRDGYTTEESTLQRCWAELLDYEGSEELKELLKDQPWSDRRGDKPPDGVPLVDRYRSDAFGALLSQC